MITNRLKGVTNITVAVMIGANCGLFFLVLWGMERTGVSLGTLSPLYVFAVLAGFFYASRRIYAQQDQILRLNGPSAFALAMRVGMGFVAGAMLIYVVREDVTASRVLIGVIALALVAIDTVFFAVLPGLLARSQFPDRRSDRAVLVGEGEVPGPLLHYADYCDDLGVRFVGYYSSRPNPDLHLPYLGNLEDFIRPGGDEAQAERVMLYGVAREHPEMLAVMEHCRRAGLRMYAYSNLANLFDEPVRVTACGPVHFFTFLDEPLEDPINRLMKRALDLALAAPASLFVLLPFSLLVYLRQRKEAPGPLFYRQLRYGESRRPFTIYKFRSMRVDNAGLEEQARQATQGDPRVYPFGRFLRRSSLDELPQLLNVLKGEMSLVGPRPLPLKLDEAVEQHCRAYRRRLFVKPGITGYAQIHGLRGEFTDADQMRERLAKDLHFIQHWSLNLEIKILLNTVWQIFNPPKSAY